MSWLILLLSSPTVAGPGAIEGTIELSTKNPSGPIIAYVEGAGPEIPDLDAARVIQQGKQFHPAAVVIRQGAIVDFANEDVVFHHVYSRTPGNTFEIEEYGRKESRSVRFDTPGVVHVRCNKHSWMEATILVLPNAWYATADASGAFAIQGVDPGERTVVLWADGHVAQKQTVTVPADGAIEVTATLDELPGDLVPGADGLPPSWYSP